MRALATTIRINIRIVFVELQLKYVIKVEAVLVFTRSVVYMMKHYETLAGVYTWRKFKAWIQIDSI